MHAGSMQDKKKGDHTMQPVVGIDQAGCYIDKLEWNTYAHG